MRCSIASRSSLAAGMSGNESRTGRVVDAVTVKAMAPAPVTLPINSASDRPTGVSDIWRNAERRFSAAIGISICRSRSPAVRTLLWLPVTKSATLIFCSLPSAFQIVQIPSSAAVNAIIGPAGNDMQRLPPTVAVFHILNDARNARQHWLIRGAAVHSGGQARASSCATVQVAAIVSSVSPIVSAGHLKSVRSTSRVRWAWGSENSQVPPASQASPAVQTGSCARVFGCATSVMVFKSMDTLELSTRCYSLYQVLQDRRQLLPWIGLVFELQGQMRQRFSAPYFTGAAAGHGSNQSDLDQ